jgi:hypothetical protein
MADDERPGMNVLFHYDAGAALVQRLDALRADGLQVTTCAAQDSSGPLSQSIDDGHESTGRFFDHRCIDVQVGDGTD